MRKQFFDIAVLGGGPGGYVAAIKAAQKNRSVALIEADKVGGTCLNRGCIPTKALLAGADVLHKVRHAEEFGIHTGEVHFSYERMKERKDSVVDSIVKSLGGLIASNRITLIKGKGKLVSPREIKILGEEPSTIEAGKIILATGSEPLNIPTFPFDGKKIHSSTSILEMTTLPKKLVIIGAGYIGCEFASLYAELGVKVILIEALPRIVPMEAEEISQTLGQAFDDAGVEIHVLTHVKSIDTSKKGVKVYVEGGDPISADCALVSIGRQLNTQDIGLENAGIATDRKGAIPVNERMETEVPGIYAIGDITAKWMLAHVASHQGIVAASNATGEPMEIHYEAVPSVIFTHPEVASVGYTLEQAKEKGFNASLGTFPFQALGKSQAADQDYGFSQVVVDSTTGQILGAQVVGYEAGTLIAEMTLAIQNELTVDCLAETIHAHPTISESWLEATLLSIDAPIHFPPKTKKKAAPERKPAGSC